VRYGSDQAQARPGETASSLDTSLVGSRLSQKKPYVN
jgi:hypothetical protein